MDFVDQSIRSTWSIVRRCQSPNERGVARPLTACSSHDGLGIPADVQPAVSVFAFGRVRSAPANRLARRLAFAASRTPITSEITFAPHCFPFKLRKQSIIEVIVGCRASDEFAKQIISVLDSDASYAHVRQRRYFRDRRDYKLRLGHIAEKES